MKKLIYLMLFIGLNACTENQIVRDDMPSLAKPFNIFFQDNFYSIQSKADLEAFTKTAIDLKQVQLLEAGIEKMEDEIGMFYAIRAEYFTNAQHATVIIPLAKNDETAKTENANTYYSECTMTCTAQAGCTRCDQTIHERCKRQTCDCGAGNNGCEASMSF